MAQEYPYKQFGNQLKKLREKANKSIAEVSGAVEIEPKALADIELGTTRPSEDVLFLLLSYFSVKDVSAAKLWKLAGFDEDSMIVTDLDDMAGAQTDAKQPVSVLPQDARIMYTDMVHVMVNNYGVVMNFMQGGGPNMQPLAIARVGMSKEHAKSVLEVLRQTLEQAEKGSNEAPKLLSDDSQKSDQTA